MLHQIITRHASTPVCAAPTSGIRSLTRRAGVHPLHLAQRHDTLMVMRSPARLTTPALAGDVTAGAGWLAHVPAGVCRHAGLTGQADLLLIDVSFPRAPMGLSSSRNVARPRHVSPTTCFNGLSDR